MDYWRSTPCSVLPVPTVTIVLSSKPPRLDGGTPLSLPIMSVLSPSTQTTVIPPPNMLESMKDFSICFAIQPRSHRLSRTATIDSCLALARITLGAQQRALLSSSPLETRVVSGVPWETPQSLLILCLHKG